MKTYRPIPYRVTSVIPSPPYRGGVIRVPSHPLPPRTSPTVALAILHEEQTLRSEGTPAPKSYPYTRKRPVAAYYTSSRSNTLGTLLSELASGRSEATNLPSY